MLEAAREDYVQGLRLDLISKVTDTSVVDPHYIQYYQRED